MAEASPSFFLSDGTDLTALFNYLTSENSRLRAEAESCEPVAEEGQEEFVLAHVDLLPEEFVELVKALLIPHILSKELELQSETPHVTYPFDDLEATECVDYSESGEVDAASLTKLVEIVTSNASSELTSVLLATFPLYTTADSLLSLILARLQVPVPKLMTASEHAYFVQHRLKGIHTMITAVIKQWIKMWPDSFRVGTHLFTQLGEFFPANREFSVEANTRILAKQLSKVQEEQLSSAVFTEERLPPPPILPKELDFKSNPLLFWSTEELSRQATLVDLNALKKIQIPECLGRRWDQEKGLNAPNITRFSQRYGSRRALFISSIVKEADLDTRIRLVSKLLELAACCLDQFHNFETPWIIKGVFMSEVVHDLLPITMREVLKKHANRAVYARIMGLYDIQTFEAVKVEMERACTMPCWLALRQDLYKIDLSWQDFTQNGLINMYKHAKTAKIVLKLREYQSKDLCFHKIALCYHFLKAKNFAIDDKECERRAKALER